MKTRQLKEISNLHLITAGATPEAHLKCISNACRGGTEWVQLRAKDISEDQLKVLSRSALELCREHGAKLIINDHPEIAKQLDADGVHLGKEDMSPAEARKILGGEKIIGGTANTVKDIEKLVQQNVDYIGLGPYRFTETKKNLSAVLGVEGYENIIEVMEEMNIDLPVIAIGGIAIEDVLPLMETGVHGVAVSSAINSSDDPAGTAEAFHQELLKSLMV